MAELVGVSYQQAYKYEQGINRISAGRLFALAGALGVEVAYFYEGLDGAPAAWRETRSRKLLEFAREFAAIGGPRTRLAVCNLARVLAGGPPGGEEGP